MLDAKFYMQQMYNGASTYKKKKLLKQAGMDTYHSARPFGHIPTHVRDALTKQLEASPDYEAMIEKFKKAKQAAAIKQKQEATA